MLQECMLPSGRYKGEIYYFSKIDPCYFFARIFWGPDRPDFLSVRIDSTFRPLKLLRLYIC